eukprot:942509_1
MPPTTAAPTTDPTISPTYNPTRSPTPQDIDCDYPGIVTEYDGTYEYYIHITEKSSVRFDTCLTLNLFDINITDTNDITNSHSCVRCGSICPREFQYQTMLTPSKYFMKINGPHAFKMICTPRPDTYAPTRSPITRKPTESPSMHPTANPTTARPTEPVHPVFNVTFPKGMPESTRTFMGDPYGRFEASIEVVVDDVDNALKVTALCSDCFIWQYRIQGGVWIDVDPTDNADISVYNSQLDTNEGITTYQSKLTIQSTRRLNAGRCFDEDDSSSNVRIFKPGNTYELRLRFLVDSTYFMSVISNALSITTNTLPYGGVCVIQNLENLEPLMEYNLFCTGWNDNENMEFNALLKDVLMSKSTYVDDPRELRSIAPVGNVSIIVLVKQKNVDNAITCYPIRAQFKTIAEAISDKLNIGDNTTNSTQNVTAVVDEILTDVSTLTEETSLSDNPDVAVSIVSVV